MSPKEVLKFAKENKAVCVDLKFLDFLGIWQHFTVPTSELKESLFDEGLGFDGSSIRGWQPIHASDMLVMPDPATAVMDPFTQAPTLSLICDIQDPMSRESYSRDPRGIAKRAVNFLKSTGLGDSCIFAITLCPRLQTFGNVTQRPRLEHLKINRVSACTQPRQIGGEIEQLWCEIV